MTWHPLANLTFGMIFGAGYGREGLARPSAPSTRLGAVASAVLFERHLFHPAFGEWPSVSGVQKNGDPRRSIGGGIAATSDGNHEFPAFFATRK